MLRFFLVSEQFWSYCHSEEYWWVSFWKCQIWYFKLVHANTHCIHTEKATLGKTSLLRLILWANDVSRIYYLFSNCKYLLITYWVPGTMSNDGGSKVNKTKYHLWGVQSLKDKDGEIHHVVCMEIPQKIKKNYHWSNNPTFVYYIQ